jgi:hypothetical protein
MPELFPWLLLLHVAGAVAGFGPTLILPRIAGMGAREPEHSTFATRLALAITRRWVVPIAVVVFASGLGLIVVAGIDVVQARWLLLSIAIFASSFGYSTLIQGRDLARIIELMAVCGPVAATGEIRGQAAQREELRARRQRVRRGGLFLRLAVLSILFLMVVQPTF